MTIALIDMDVVVYRAGFASERKRWIYKHKDAEIEFDFKISKKKVIDELLCRDITPIEENWRAEMQYDDVSFALSRAKLIINAMIAETQTTSHKGFLSTTNDETLFRNKIAKTAIYKGNRKDFKKPYHYEAIRQYIRNYYLCDEVKGIEADDALGIHQNKNTIICSIDKDLLQIPGRHYNFVKKRLYEISEIEGWHNFYSQVLMGDKADNIPGLYGIKDKKSEYILAKCTTPKEMYDNCIKAYKLYSKREDYMDYLHEQAHLLYIWRKPKDKWAPPT